ncbi:MAG: transketolase-like TK C-terminal-containing protein, partial [Mycobacteriales bacterium]
GAGWHVIKVVWGREWDELLARDADGVLVNAMNTTPDGQFQTYSVSDGAFIREDFFGRDHRLRRMVDHLSDEALTRLSRGGHDYRKVYAAFKAAREHTGQPTVILAQTIKGWTLGKDFEARNATHQMKKLTKAELHEFRDRLYLPISDRALDADLPPYYHPGPEAEEVRYLQERRAALGGFLPRRVVRAKPLPLPPADARAYTDLAKGSGRQEVATTMAFVRLLKDLMKDKGIGPRFVPIIPDEARTFGMDSLFPTAKIYSPFGQRYDAVDRDLLLSYKESEDGQILHEGISEAGCMASTTAAGTSYATHGEHMIPVFVFYSMFGFQRVGDAIWAFSDQLGHGFLLGATAGRTTLNGEGLQHQDGHSPLLAASNPACVAYDPAFAYEIGVIVEDALRRMYGENPENVFYYLTIYNEAIVQPPAPEDLDRDGLLRGLYRYREAPSAAVGRERPRAQILASGSAMAAALAAQDLLAADFGVAADVWSVTSWTELRRDAVTCEEQALTQPEQAPRPPWVTQALDGVAGPIVAVSDFMRAVPDLIARWIPGDYTSLGTDGYGRSDTRAALRSHFHTDAPSIAAAVLQRLAARGEVKAELIRKALDRGVNS